MKIEEEIVALGAEIIIRVGDEDNAIFTVVGESDILREVVTLLKNEGYSCDLEPMGLRLPDKIGRIMVIAGEKMNNGFMPLPANNREADEILNAAGMVGMASMVSLMVA